MIEATTRLGGEDAFMKKFFKKLFKFLLILVLVIVLGLAGLLAGCDEAFDAFEVNHLFTSFFVLGKVRAVI